MKIMATAIDYTERYRLRRRNDPDYRAWYNALRREYYQRKKSDPEYAAKLREKARRYRTRVKKAPKL